jgi:hypothetical protein
MWCFPDCPKVAARHRISRSPSLDDAIAGKDTALDFTFELIRARSAP